MSSNAESVFEFNETNQLDTSQWQSCEGESWISYMPFLYPQFGILDYEPWIMSVMGSVLVGLSGILPLLIIPVDDTATLKNGSKLEFP